MASNTEKSATSETHTVGPGIGRETLKKVKNEKYTMYCLEYGEKTEILENETHTQKDLENGEK